jgi:transcription antitermination factor NusG
MGGLAFGCALGLAEFGAGEMAAEKQISWGVAHTTAYGFDSATDELKKLGFSVFAPKVRTMDVKRFGRAKTLATPIERPLFRGYVFVGWVAGSDDWAAAVDARGVVDLLRSCGKLSAPSVVPAFIMDGLMKAGEIIDLTQQHRDSPKVRFNPGDMVKVSKPGFEEQVWRIARLDPRGRIRFILQSVRPGYENFEPSVSAEDLMMVKA